MVRARGGPCERGFRLLEASLVGETFGEPERARNEAAFIARERVVAPVTADEPVIGEFVDDGIGRGQHTGVAPVDVAESGDDEGGGVELSTAEGLEKDISL